MSRRALRLFNLCEAFVLVVVRHAHDLFDEDHDDGSLAPLRADLLRALDHNDDVPALDSWLFEQLGHQVREALAAPWAAPGDEEGRREAFIAAVVSELQPFVDGKNGLARRAGLMLALLLDDEARAEALAAQLRG